MERLILLEHTTPNDNLDFPRRASGGGIPGGVDGRGNLGGVYPAGMMKEVCMYVCMYVSIYLSERKIVTMVGSVVPRTPNDGHVRVSFGVACMIAQLLPTIFVRRNAREIINGWRGEMAM